MITGGEPFIKNDIEKLILGIVNQENNHRINITTNGYYCEKIENLLMQVKNPEKISFAISLDGLEECHNRIRGNKYAYQHAITTIRILLKYGVAGQVNTVIQQSNINDLADLKKEINELSEGKIVHAFIPLVSQISKTKKFTFNKAELKIMWPYLTDSKDKKYLISQGNFKIETCHAGINNILINPQGKIYSCLTGYSYLEADEKEKYCMGDLHEKGIDGILKEACAVAATSCLGCNNPCEIIREREYFGLDCELTEEEIFSLYINDIISQNTLIYDQNCFTKEGEGEESFRWMKGNTSSIYMQTSAKMLNIKVINCMPALENEEELKLTVSIGSEKYMCTCRLGLNEFEIAKNIVHKDDDLVKIVLSTNYAWKPSERIGSGDDRMLGVALVSINEWK